MKKLIKGLFILGIVFFLFAICLPQAFAAAGLWDYSFIHTDAPSISFAWDPGSACPAEMTCGYEVELRHLEQNFIDRYTVTGPTITVAYKKSGHYQLFVRFWATADMKSFTYSDWGDSTKSGTITISVTAPVQKGWLLYWRLPPPGGGEIQ